MNTTRATIISITSLILSLAQSQLEAASEIDVLVAFAPGAISTDAATYAIDRELDMALYLARSNMPQKAFRFRPHLLPAAFPSGTVNAGVALTFLQNEADPLIKASRNTGTWIFPSDLTSFDLVLLVVEALTDDDGDFVCGAARSINSNLVTNWQLVPNPSENRFMMVLSDSQGCRGRASNVVPHEIGHIFGGDHQAAGTHSSLTNDDDEPSEPLPYNHPHVILDSNGFINLATVMASSPSSGAWARQYSSDAPNDVLFLEPSESAGNQDADMKTLMNDQWNMISEFRPMPTPCTIDVQQVCVNNSPQAIVTPTLAGGFTMTNIDMEYRLGGSSNWYPIYDGSPTCPIYNPPSNFMNSIVSALVTTAAGHVTGCEINVIPIYCGNGDEW